MSFLPSTGFTRVGAYSIQICQLISNCLFVFKIVSANRVACSFIGFSVHMRHCFSSNQADLRTSEDDQLF